MQAQYKLLTGAHRDEFVTIKFNSVTAAVNFPNQTKTLSLETFHYLVDHHFLIYTNDDRLKSQLERRDSLITKITQSYDSSILLRNLYHSRHSK